MDLLGTVFFPFQNYFVLTQLRQFCCCKFFTDILCSLAKSNAPHSVQVCTSYRSKGDSAPPHKQICLASKFFLIPPFQESAAWPAGRLLGGDSVARCGGGEPGALPSNTIAHRPPAQSAFIRARAGASRFTLLATRQRIFLRSSWKREECCHRAIVPACWPKSFPPLSVSSCGRSIPASLPCLAGHLLLQHAGQDGGFPQRGHGPLGLG